MDKKQIKTISQSIGKFVLATAVGGGIVALFSIFPGLPLAFAPFVSRDKYYGDEDYQRTYARKVIKRLKQKGLVKILEKEGKTMLAITKLGKKQLEKWQLGDLKIERPKKWDGRWRIAIFDIPEKKHRARDIVREQLKDFGFYYLQNSVWIYPYPCEEIILAIAKAYDLLPYMIYIEANYLGDDRYLKRHFKI